eukprot:TRINITY_DN1278_c0_g2_i3.p5 TRINITY_DN1278_c0_g2~~TRINITY_DN1278_c0_g2_i3.p5  ORF type:complete len:105 (+),score=7.87 TRINITY_DN1278_c0_g2_i3:688-1002(+)
MEKHLQGAARKGLATRWISMVDTWDTMLEYATVELVLPKNQNNIAILWINSITRLEDNRGSLLHHDLDSAKELEEVAVHKTRISSRRKREQCLFPTKLFCSRVR